MKVTYDSRIFDKKSFKSQCNILIKTKMWVQRQEARNEYLIYSDLTKNCIQMFFLILKQNSKNNCQEVIQAAMAIQIFKTKNCF